MRNLKRALSLALAFIMVMSLMIVGTSAKTFTDAEDISNVEAVTIVDGLSVMNGYPDGSFKPEGIVTRAEMAVVISKMLYGPNFNPANFEGAGTFTDTPDWAEGYINLCASLNIIAGRGNGIFDPDATVTTSEAAAMFLRALGYLQTAEEFGTDWQLAVTSKATNLGLYGDLKLSINEGLSRENVAEMAFNTLFAQRVAYDDYRGLYVKANDRNVVVTNGTEDEMNTLAQNTFGLYIAEGVVVANGQTDKKLSASLKSDAQTTVMFTEAADLNKDGKNEYAEGDTYDFEVETGLDMIGHAASVYYKMENKAPVVYAIVDEATLVSVIDYDDNTTILADAANDAGFKKNSILDVSTADYILNYDMDVTLAKAEDDSVKWADGITAIDPEDIPDGKKLIAISNSGNLQVDYVIVLDQQLDVVRDVETDDDETLYTLKATGAVDEEAVAVSAVDEGDFVLVTDIGNRGDYYVFAPATVLNADISKIVGRTNGTGEVTKVVADGVEYVESQTYHNATPLSDEEVIPFATIDTMGAATLILDQFGDLIAILGEPTLPNYAYVAEYGVRHSTSGLNTDNVLTAKIYFADGTSGVYEVSTSSYKTLDSDLTDEMVQNHEGDVKKALNGAALRDATIVDKTTTNAVNGKDITAARGLYDVSVKDDVATIKAITTEVIGDVKAVDDDGTAYDEAVQLVKGHSTLLAETAKDTVSNVATTQTIKSVAPASMYNKGVLYQNTNTVYFYISYTDGSLSVKPVVGIKNAYSFTNGVENLTGKANTNVGIKEAFASLEGIENRAVMDVMLVANVDLGQLSEVYYHDVEDYSVRASQGDEDGAYTLVYKMYDLETGEMEEVAYDGYDSFADAKSDATSKWDGFYTLGGSNINVYAAQSNSDNDYKSETKSSVTYITNDTANYDEYVDNLFGGNSKLGAIIDQDEVIIKDICDSGLTSVSKLVKAIKEDGNVNISFTWNASYETYVIFVTYYNPDKAEVPGGTVETDYSLNVTDFDVTDDGVVTYDATVMDGDAKATMTGATDVKATYTVKMLAPGGEKTSVYTADIATTGASGAIDLTKATLDTVAIPNLKVSNTGNTIYEIQVNITFKLGGQTYTIGGTFDIA